MLTVHISPQWNTRMHSIHSIHSSRAVTIIILIACILVEKNTGSIFKIIPQSLWTKLWGYVQLIHALLGVHSTPLQKTVSHSHTGW